MILTLSLLGSRVVPCPWKMIVKVRARSFLLFDCTGATNITACGVLDEHEITGFHQVDPVNRDTILWAPWDAITRIQQGSHDSIFPSVVHRRIPVWAGSFVDKDISAAASNTLPRLPSAARMFRSMLHKVQQGQKRKAASN